jgi:hypothetical protein
MRISNRTSFVALAALMAICTAAPSATFAAGDPAKPTPKPSAKPDDQRRVWTNEDVARLNPAYVAGPAKSATVITVVPSVVVTPEGPKIATVAVASALPAEQDPAWYARQLDSLQTQFADVQARQDRLQNFRATGAGLQPGLELNSPVEGISTDNLIAALVAERQSLLDQIDTIQDLARRNGLNASQLVLPAPSAADSTAALAQTVRGANSQLNGIALTEAVMNAKAAELHATLQQPTPGFGGNMTTDLLDRLNTRAAKLQSAIDGADDSARTLGVASGDLR